MPNLITTAVKRKRYVPPPETIKAARAFYQRFTSHDAAAKALRCSPDTFRAVLGGKPIQGAALRRLQANLELDLQPPAKTQLDWTKLTPSEAIAEAKRAIAAHNGIDPAQIHITVTY
jgi:hypothetical protein